MLEKIISGGQTGADMGGLLAARDLGITTGGWAAKGWMTEDGPKPELAEFGLAEFIAPGYPPRTKANVRDSDATLLICSSWGPGTRLTRRYCDELDKPGFHTLVLEDAQEAAFFGRRLAEWLLREQIGVLNVAGTRESHHPGIQEWVRVWLRENLLHALIERASHAD